METQSHSPQTKFERINIEISNSCNLKCTFCPAVERGEQVLSPDKFQYILDEVGPFTKEVVLHLLGEPLGHPEFKGILEVASRSGVPVNVVTNGILLHGDRPELLLKPIVRQVSFSLQSFESNFPGRDPKVYVDRIYRFIQQALELRPDLYINLRFWDLSGFGAVDTSRNQTMRDYLADVLHFSWSDINVDLRRRKNWRLTGRLYLHFDSRFEWPHMSNPIRQEVGTCQALKGHIGIHADGTVVPCCLDHKGDLPLGNLFKESLHSILSSPRAVKMRQGFDQGILTEELCKRCGFIERFSKKKKSMLV